MRRVNEKRKRQSEQKEERLQRIIQLMTVPGAWRTGVTGKQLAKEYGVHQTTIDREAAEAARYVRGDLFDREVLRALYVSQTQALVAASLKMKRPRDAMHGIELQAKLMGLLDASSAPQDTPRHVQVEIVRYKPPTSGEDGDVSEA